MRFLLVAALCMALAGCKQASGHEASDADAALIARGMEVYKEQSCGVCHTLTAVGTGGVFGPSHNGVGKRAEERIKDPNYHGKATTAQAYIRESILDPGAYRVPGFEHTRFAMPAYTGLSDDDLAALVAMLASNRGED